MQEQGRGKPLCAKLKNLYLEGNTLEPKMTINNRKWSLPSRSLQPSTNTVRLKWKAVLSKSP